MCGLRAVMFRLRDHRRVRVTMRVDRREVLIVIVVGSVTMSQCNFIKARRTEEGLVPQPEHVEARDAGGDHADEPERVAKCPAAQEGLVEDLVLREKGSEWRHARNCEYAGAHRIEGDRNALAKAAHVAHV